MERLQTSNYFAPLQNAMQGAQDVSNAELANAYKMHELETRQKAAKLAYAKEKLVYDDHVRKSELEAKQREAVAALRPQSVQNPAYAQWQAGQVGPPNPNYDTSAYAGLQEAVNANPGMARLSGSDQRLAAMKNEPGVIGSIEYPGGGVPAPPQTMEKPVTMADKFQAQMKVIYDADPMQGALTELKLLAEADKAIPDSVGKQGKIDIINEKFGTNLKLNDKGLLVVDDRERGGFWTPDKNDVMKFTAYPKDDEALLKMKGEQDLERERIRGDSRLAAVLARPVSAGGSGGGGGKPPAGYRYTPDGNLEPIPGGPAAQKAQDRAQGQGNAQAAIDLSIATIDKLENHPGRAQATGKSRILQTQRIPGTDAYGFDKELESFDAQLFLSNISSMKGMGALSNAEGMKVSAAAGAIKPGMKDAAFLSNIKDIKNSLTKAKQRIETGQLVNPDGSPQRTGSTGLPNGNGKALDPKNAALFIQAAGGDKDKARELAKAQGWKF